MSTATAPLPITDTRQPASQDELAEMVRAAHAERTPLYTLGGGTALGFGLTAKRAGIGVATSGLTQVIDYPARDMTITVESGITMAALAATLAAEGQRLPIDAAEADHATLGGVVATNFSGPRRYGFRTIRDYVIGISAVDGRGTPFKAGGRVVKNVAGYDFCKLLTGSLGTLGIITQLTLKVVPLAESTAFLVCDLRDAAQAEALLAALVDSRTHPTAVEWLAGPAWRDDPDLGPPNDGGAGRLVVGFEGTSDEVEWMLGQLASEWQAAGVDSYRTIPAEQAAGLWHRLTEFDAADESALVIKTTLVPSRVAAFVELLRECGDSCSIQAHAGSGIVIARFAEFAAEDVSHVLIQRLQPAAATCGGSVVVWASNGVGELTRQATWGPARSDMTVMRSVKAQFDPEDLLNPGRFVYGD